MLISDIAYDLEFSVVLRQHIEYLMIATADQSFRASSTLLSKCRVLSHMPFYNLSISWLSWSVFFLSHCLINEELIFCAPEQYTYAFLGSVHVLIHVILNLVCNYARQQLSCGTQICYGPVVLRNWPIGLVFHDQDCSAVSAIEDVLLIPLVTPSVLPLNHGVM